MLDPIFYSFAIVSIIFSVVIAFVFSRIQRMRGKKGYFWRYFLAIGIIYWVLIFFAVILPSMKPIYEPLFLPTESAR